MKWGGREGFRDESEVLGKHLELEVKRREGSKIGSRIK